MYLEMHQRLTVIKTHIDNNEPITNEELADAVTIAISFDNMITDICSALKKESEANE